MCGWTGWRERRRGINGGSALDVSIRPGAVGFSTGKVATVETVTEEGREKQPSSCSSSFRRFPLPPRRYEWDFFGAGGRGSETLRGLFASPSSEVLVPSAFYPGTRERWTLFLSRSIVIFFTNAYDALIGRVYFFRGKSKIIKKWKKALNVKCAIYC